MSISIIKGQPTIIYSFFNSFYGNVPYNIILRHTSQKLTEEKSIIVEEFGERVKFELTTELPSGIGDYKIFANGEEVEIGVLNIK